jgi:hypothetical protein
MANREQHNNREKRKPKKGKLNTAPVTSPVTSPSSLVEAKAKAQAAHDRKKSA